MADVAARGRGDSRSDTAFDRGDKPLPPRRPWAARYGAAVLAAASALVLQAILIPLFGGGPNSTPFIVFFAAVMVSAWYGGLGPGLLSSVLSVLLSWYFFVSPQFSLAIVDPGQALRLLVFAGECVVLSALAGAMHRARERAEAGALELRNGEALLRARARQQAAVADLGRRALEDHDLQALMEEAAVSVAEVLDVQYTEVLELLAGGEELLLRAGVGWDEGLVGRTTVGADRDSQAGFTLLAGEPVVVEDLSSEERFTGPPLLREYGVVSGMSAVVRGRSRPFGVLGAHTKGRRAFTEDDVNFLRALANVLAAAIERQRAEEELRASREQLEVVLRGVADGVTAQDTSGELVYANDVAARIAGYPSARAMVETPTAERMEALEVTDESGRSFPPERLPGRRALAGEGGAEEVLRFRVLGTGKERWTVAKAAPVFDERGRVTMAVSIFRDVTERRRSEEAMRRVREAERARMARDLHDGVLQDLSYTAASMGVMMLEAEGTDLEGQLQAAIGAVRRAAQGLRDAVNDLRLEAEADRPFPELVRSLVEEGRLMDPGCDMRLEVEDGFPAEPLGEAGVEISRVLREALTNARRHSGAKSVTVTLGSEGGDLVAEVSDDGRGFGPEAEPGGGSRSMRERAAAVGGELTVESEPGRGTTVRLRVPLPREAEE